MTKEFRDLVLQNLNQLRADPVISKIMHPTFSMDNYCDECQKGPFLGRYNCKECRRTLRIKWTLNSMKKVKNEAT